MICKRVAGKSNPLQKKHYLNAKIVFLRVPKMSFTLSRTIRKKLLEVSNDEEKSEYSFCSIDARPILPGCSGCERGQAYHH
jgi:hypothetical protein